MAPMIPGLVVAYEIPSAKGRGHRLMVPVGGGVSGEEAAHLIASIRGPVHVSADRLGISRQTRQNARGTIRDSSAKAVVVGIDVFRAPPSTVMSALAALEASLDEAFAEASDSESIDHSTVLPSSVATRMVDSIAAIGFREFSDPLPTPVVTRRMPTPNPQGGGGRHQSLLVGSMAILVSGIAIGWIASSGIDRVRTTAIAPRPRVPPSEETITSAQVPITSELSHPEAAVPRPAELNSRPAVLGPAFLEEESEPVIPTPSAQSRPTPGRGQGDAADAANPTHSPPRTLQQNAEKPLETSIVFHVECTGTVEGDRVQLGRLAKGDSRGNSRFIAGSVVPIGLEKVAESDHVSFDVKPTNGAATPNSLFFVFTSKEPPLSFGGSERTYHRLTSAGSGDSFGCEFMGTPDRLVQVVVTVEDSSD
jgi:hypothetical protein